ncbi:MAG: GH116 family glycosyl hydrolase, partial [Candidatus Saccharibacteria bacterium]|nr:GH116 family glycosyl hydrolase [Candidatus Saccharibacteria bacterium]
GGGTNDYRTVQWGEQKNWYTPDYNRVPEQKKNWYDPGYNGTPGGSDAVYYHMFATRFNDANGVANYMTNNYESLFKRIVAWQEVVYSEESLPVWLRESLVNILHLITEDGLWAQAKAPIGNWCRSEDGLFAMNESPRDCPQMECIPCSFYGSMPLNYFFPKLAMSTMRGYINYMTYDGAAPWIFGGCTSRSEPSGARNCVFKPTASCAMHLPVRGYQTTTNGISFAAMADRIWMCSGYDKGVLKELYPWVKKNTIYTMNLRTEDGPDGIVSMPTGNIGTEWFEHCEWRGIVAHVGGLHLAQLRIAERMAKKYGDKDFEKLCQKWFTDGSNSMEKYLWNGNYYLNFVEPGTGAKSDLVFSYQLDGEWITDFHGLPYCFPEKNVKTALATIKRANSKLSSVGFLSFLKADGTAAFGGEGVMKSSYDPYAFFNAELLMLTMNYMYEGQRDFGLNLARNCMESIVCKHLYTWDMPNMIRGDTGKVTFGKDYYQMLMLWSLPAAINKEDMAGPTQKGGLVNKMIRAANPQD